VVLDGELVVVDGAGRCDFDAACDRLKSQHGPPVTIFVFDIPALEGEDLRAPLRERKSALARVLRRGDSTLRPVHFIAGPPDSMIAAVDDLELEGVVAKWEGARIRVAAPHSGRSLFSGVLRRVGESRRRLVIVE
jgi:bifunctional non-homologous end joining protein LigD